MKPSGQLTTRRTKSSVYLQLTILLFVCVATGFNQGLLLPLLTVMLEKSGISAGMNGLNSTALYIGVFATMFFIRKPVAAFGYRNVIAVGLLLAAASAIAFLLWQSVGAWFALRLIVGIGDSALHYATQLWIITGAPENRRGRFISLYGSRVSSICWEACSPSMWLAPYSSIAERNKHNNRCNRRGCCNVFSHQ